jgi:hypothetical protein
VKFRGRRSDQRALLKFIRRRSRATSDIRFDSRGISLVAGTVTVWTLPWSDIRRIIAFRTAGFVGEDLVLAIESLSSETRLVSEGQDGWKALTAALPLHLAGAHPYEDWALRVAIDADAEPLTVFDRG